MRAPVGIDPDADCVEAGLICAALAQADQGYLDGVHGRAAADRHDEVGPKRANLLHELEHGSAGHVLGKSIVDADTSRTKRAVRINHAAWFS